MADDPNLPSKRKHPPNQLQNGGAWPPPDVLEHIEARVPGGTERILDNWLTEGAHRRELERNRDTRDHRRYTLSTWLSFLLLAGCLGVGAYLVSHGHDVAGVTIATGSVVSAAVAMIKVGASRTKPKDERDI